MLLVEISSFDSNQAYENHFQLLKAFSTIPRWTSSLLLYILFSICILFRMEKMTMEVTIFRASVLRWKNEQKGWNLFPWDIIIIWAYVKGARYLFTMCTILIYVYISFRVIVVCLQLLWPIKNNGKMTFSSKEKRKRKKSESSSSEWWK